MNCPYMLCCNLMCESRFTVDWQDRYHPRREPEPVLRVMTPDDIPAGCDVLRDLGWEPDVRRWERILAWAPEGCFVLDEPERGVIGTVSTTPYGTALGWIGMMVVTPDRQRRGYGRRLMRAALDFLIARGTERIMLDATDVGRPLYESLGFRALHKVFRWEGKASTYLGMRGRRMAAEDVDGVLALDERLFGVARRHLLVPLLEEFPDLAWVDADRDGLQGYLMGRWSAKGAYLGPWMATTAGSAERLLRTALEQLQGEPVMMDISDTNDRAMLIAGNHNLSRASHCMRMIYGDTLPIQGELLTELAIGSHATG